MTIMKKVLIIALSAVIILFSACKKEKPNAKFIGNYKGSATVNATSSYSLFGQPFEQEIPEFAVPVEIDLTAGNTDNKVILIYVNADLNETYTTTGLVSENSVDFEPMNVNFTHELNNINASIDLKGTLIDSNILSLEADIEGKGTTQFISVPITVKVTESANLNKSVQSE